MFGWGQGGERDDSWARGRCGQQVNVLLTVGCSDGVHW